MVELISYQLAQSSEHWAYQFKDCNKFWTSTATKPDYWTLGAKVCLRHDIPPEMLIALVHNHLNDSSQDFCVDFHSNVMKAEGLIERAIGNARIFYRRNLKEMKEVALISSIEVRGSDSMLDMMRNLAELILENYRIGMDLMWRQASPSKNADSLPASLKDSIAYRCCAQNPFLLLDRAREPLTRHLAYNNVRALLKYQPWVKKIWDGLLLDGSSLEDEEKMAGQPPNPNPFHGVNWGWPPDIRHTYTIAGTPIHPELELPRMFLGRPLFQGYVSAVIAAKAEMIRRENPQIGSA